MTARHSARSPLAGTQTADFCRRHALHPRALIVLLEIVLRIVHYGPDISLFTTIDVAGKEYRVMNPGVGKRYFPGTEFTPATSLDAFEVVKPPGTYRIFCLGGSTTVGYPYWFNAAFSTFLRSRLHALFPDRPIEVINLGLTATNSFTVLDIARDLADAEPDLILVYDGHNEFYGALGVASRESPSGARWLTDLSLRLLRFRTYRLVRDAYFGIGRMFSTGHTGEDRGTMMERLARGENVPAGSRLYREALETFRANIRATVDLCASRGIPLIFGTQVSNVRTVRPFVSLPREGMSPAELNQFTSALAGGLDALAARRTGEALPLLRKAVGLDSLRADAEYALATCLESLGDISGARTAYARARDLDQLRFRASSDFNGAICAAANGTSVGVVDMESLFAGASPDSIVGNELIFEHLHPTSRGYFLMAKGYARTMEQLGLIAGAESWRARDTTPDERLWESALFRRWTKGSPPAKSDILTSGWPFREGVPIVPAVSPADTLGQIVEMFTRSRWSWEQAHEEAIALLRQKDGVGLRRDGIQGHHQPDAA